ncbi:MAG: pepO, partial [Pedosphaera sp.]|nr:pepO [Pedosphaera sp.]
MNKSIYLTHYLAVAGTVLLIANPSPAADSPPKTPGFSVKYMDTTVDPSKDFYHYACGMWLKENPVPADKSRWGGFGELQERNWFLIHQILDSTTQTPAQPNSPVQKVGDFFKSAMDTNRLEELGFKPLEADLKRIEVLKSPEDLLRLVANFHDRGVGACFGESVSPDAKNSAVYAFELEQGGLGLPDRDYYLSDAFAKQREAYVGHITKMFGLLGEQPTDAQAHAATVLELETALAKASKSRVDMRDPIANYHKFTVAELAKNYPDLPLKVYMAETGLEKVPDLIMGQPDFFAGLDKLVKDRPLDDWKTYLRWHLVHSAAPFLNAAAEQESFAFYGTVLRGQP